MDFVGMFAQLAESPEFQKKVAEAFANWVEVKKIPGPYRPNHDATFTEGAKHGASALAEIIGETMEKHPYLAKQAMKLLGAEEKPNGRKQVP